MSPCRTSPSLFYSDSIAEPGPEGLGLYQIELKKRPLICKGLTHSESVSPVSNLEILEVVVVALLVVSGGRLELQQQDLPSEAVPELGDVVPDLKCS